MNTLSRKPFLPSVHPRTGKPFIRAVACCLLAHAQDKSVQSVVKDHWKNDKDVEILLRSAVGPADTVNPDWAGSLAATSVADFISVMGGASAGAALLKLGLQLSFNGYAAIKVPGVVAAAGNTTFVQEGQPIPVRKLLVDGPTLTPRKFATIIPFTGEIAEQSTPNIEKLVGAVLSESVGLALDLALFDATAGDDARPPGLRHGIAVTAASSSGGTPLVTMTTDIRNLAGAVAGVAGNAPIIFVASPAQAIALRLQARTDFNFDVLASAALPPGMIICIAANALASAIDATPRISVGTDTALVMQDDTMPAEFGAGGPLRSLFQTDSLALRLILEVSWALRNPAALAWSESVLW
jgi:hypothetical protein